jgi:hypothetical protein
MGIESDIKKILQDVIDEEDGNQSKAARRLGVGPVTLWGWLNKEKLAQKNAPLWTALDNAGAKILREDATQAEASREVCFVEAKVVPAGDGQGQKPASEDYLAVPLVEEVGAGPGIIPQGELLSWFLVWRHQRAVMGKRDLIAVQIAEHSTSMVPTLCPGDIVLVDRQDLDCSRPGRIMLAIDPDGSGMIKRVSTRQIREERDWQITFYSDNAAENPPMVYSLQKDYGGEWRKVVGGHVVWAWSDMEGR